MAPLWLRLVVLSVLVGSLVAGYCGPAPRRRCPPRRRVAALACSLLFLLAALPALIAGERAAGAILAGLSVEGLCLTAWLARHRSDDDPPDEEESPPPPDDPEYLDWDRFEHDFRAYAEQRGSGASRPSGSPSRARPQ